MSTSSPDWAGHLRPGTDPASVDVAAEGSLPAAWTRAWSDDPGATILTDGRDPSRRITAGRLEELSAAVARRLHGRGLAPGDRVLFACSSSLDLAVLHAGALRAGTVVVPANPGYSEREMSHILADAAPAAAVADEPLLARRLAAARPAMVVLDAGAECEAAAGTARDRRGDTDLAPPDPGAPALMAYTSGTTGVPKAALHTHSSLLASARSVALAWEWGASDRLVLCLPLFHGHGLCVGLHGTLLTGASAVVLPGFDPAGVLDAVDGHRATLFFGVPTMYHRLANSPRAAELARLRLCVSGSAPLPAVLFERITAASGQRVLERYGTSETLMNISNPLVGERRPGSVGFPLPNVDIRLAEGGEICVRGPNVFAGYWRGDDVPVGVAEGGWFHTGDIGERASDGYYRILGRTKELIITGGFNVYPREVEEVLMAHPEVTEASVVGTPSDEWGEVVTAFVVATGSGVSVDDLSAHCAKRLARYKRPRLWRLVDSLPRNALGKVKKAELR